MLFVSISQLLIGIFPLRINVFIEVFSAIPGLQQYFFLSRKYSEGICTFLEIHE